MRRLTCQEPFARNADSVPALEISPYQATWPDEFLAIGGALRQGLGKWAIRIDHIGSTSVVGLAAKDIIDIQITVDDFAEDVLEARFGSLGYAVRPKLITDHEPPGISLDAEQLSKRMVKPPPDQRPTNLHIRKSGMFNQQYPLLFRDYLRSSPVAAATYGHIKQVLATKFPNDIESYYDIKDPVCDAIMAAAGEWSAAGNWTLGPSDV